MKLTQLLIVPFLLFGTFLSAQEEPENLYPKSIISVGPGVGPNYGIFGVKTVTGYKNSGLLLSVGTLDGFTTFTVGGQVAVKWWYLSVGYGSYGLHIIGNGQNETRELMKGVIAMTGGMINLGKAKRFFIDTGVGFSTGYEVEGNIFIDDRVETAFSIALGVGYRIGG